MAFSQSEVFLQGLKKIIQKSNILKRARLPPKIFIKEKFSSQHINPEITTSPLAQSCHMLIAKEE